MAGVLEFDGVVALHSGIRAVDRVTFRVAAGQKVALCGSNGSGKTTLARCILGFHRMVAGSIYLNGQSARTAHDWRERRRQVAYIPQRPSTGRFPLLVRELLDSSNSDSACSIAGLLGVGELLDRPVNTLSGGQLQRVVVARGIACTTERSVVLVADEPTSALDFDGQSEIADLLTSLPVTVFIVTHSQAIVDRCDRIIDMANGIIRERR